MRRAFTLIELLVAISLIALLLAAGSVGLAKARQSGRDTRRITDVNAVAQAIESYAAVNRGRYAASRAGSAGNFPVTELLDRTAVPSEPLPVNRGAADFPSAYVVNNRAGTSLAKPQAGPNYEYVLEVGMENAAPADATSIVKGTLERSGRTQYLLYGPLCRPAASTGGGLACRS